MSYCRSGKDSDVYVYGTKTELVLHVAWNRGPKNPPPEHPGTPAEWEAWFSEDNDIPLDHPAKGTTFETTSRKAMIDRLSEYQITGLMVPQSAIDRLSKEILEEGDHYPKER